MVALAVWLRGADQWLTAIGLGMVIGGAIGTVGEEFRVEKSSERQGADAGTRATEKMPPIDQ